MTKRAGLAARSSLINAALAAAGTTPAPKGSAPAKGKPVGLTIRLNSAVHDQLRDIAHAERRSIHSLFLEGVELVIKKRR